MNLKNIYFIGYDNGSDNNGLERFWCVQCRVSCLTISSMKNHLQSENHLEIVSMINRSVPILVRKITLTECEICCKTFRLQMSLVQHMKSIHRHTDFKPVTHKYYKCRYCTFKTLNKKANEGHLFLAHRGMLKPSWSCKGKKFKTIQ